MVGIQSLSSFVCQPACGSVSQSMGLSFWPFVYLSATHSLLTLRLMQSKDSFMHSLSRSCYAIGAKAGTELTGLFLKIFRLLSA